jgi:hypothetical protein
VTARTIPDSDAAGRDVVAEAVAYIREEADFNRSWTDGRRECTISGVHADKDGYVARRKELADRADGFADAIERLREELEVAKATEREACAKEADGFAEQAAKEGWTGKNIASRTATAIGRAIRARAASPATIPARPDVPGLDEAKEDLRREFVSFFIDGRNEHGSHVLPMPGDRIGDPDDRKDLLAAVNDQDLGFAEEIIKQAEVLGHAVGHVVVTIWSITRDPEWGPECEFVRVSPVLTDLMWGKPSEQASELAASPSPGREIEPSAEASG